MMTQNPENEALLDTIVADLRQTIVPPMPEVRIDYGTDVQEEQEHRDLFRKQLLSRRSFVIAASLLVALTLLPSLWRSSNALAQVQDAIRNANAIKFTVETLVNGKVVDSRQVLMADDRGVRAESANSLHVFNAESREMLEVDHAKRTALVSPVYESDALKRDLASAIGRLSSLEPIEETRVRETVRDGIQVTEVSAVWDGAVVVATLAPDSSLPLRLDIDRGRNPSGESVREEITEIQFDVPVSGDDFATHPPETYQLEKVARVGLAESSKQLVISDKGLGPITWGMNRDAVIARLGKPDRIETSPGMEPVVKDGKPVLTPGVGAGIKMVLADPPWELVVLQYDSRGFRVTLKSHSGVASIRCYDTRMASAYCRKFEGQTPEGVRIGMLKPQVMELLGDDEPTAAQFDFRDERLIAFVWSEPSPRSLDE